MGNESLRVRLGGPRGWPVAVAPLKLLRSAHFFSPRSGSLSHVGQISSLNPRRAGATILMLAAALASAAAIRPAVAAAKGCGPGLLGRATAWKDRNLIYDFLDVCDWHDRCYGARGYGFDPVRSPGLAARPYPREWCDQGFRQGMELSCRRRRRGQVIERACLGVASAFHWLVRKLGEGPYRSADGRRVLASLAWPS